MRDQNKEEFLAVCQGISSGIQNALKDCENFSPHMIFKALCASQVKEVIALINDYLPGEENILARDQLLKVYRGYFDQTGKRLQQISKNSLEGIPMDDAGNPSTPDTDDSEPDTDNDEPSSDVDSSMCTPIECEADTQERPEISDHRT